MGSIVPVIWIGAGAYGQFNIGHVNGAGADGQYSIGHVDWGGSLWAV